MIYTKHLKGHPEHPDFPHGESRGYRLGCRVAFPCPATPTCTSADRRRYQTNELNNRLNRPVPGRRISGDKAKEHLEALLNAECTVPQIALVSGVAINTIKRLLNTPKGCLAETADALLSVTAADCKRLGAASLRPKGGHSTDARPARAHVRRLMKLDGVGYHTIATCAGVGHDSVLSLLKNRRPVIRVATDRKIRAVTAEQLAAHVRRVTTPPKTIQLIRSMQVQGWSLKWQASQLGHGADWLLAIVTSRWTTIARDDVTKIAELARKVEGSWGPNKLRPPGWHPLACYDDSGKLIPSAVRTDEADAEKAEQEAREAKSIQTAWKQLEALRLSMAGASAAQVSADIDVDSSQVHRWRAELGLRFSGIGGPSDGARLSALRPECSAQAVRVQEVLSVFRNDPTADPRELRRQLRALKTRSRTDRVTTLAG